MSSRAILILLILSLALIGCSRRRSIVETLEAPIPLVGWNAQGLTLADGSHVSLPGIARLPAVSEALSMGTQRGIEIGRTGRVVGLLRVHRWCGNDPVKEHIARVDLAHLVMFLHDVPLEADLGDLNEWRNLSRAASFTDWGWRVGEYLRFQSWSATATERGV